MYLLNAKICIGEDCCVALKKAHLDSPTKLHEAILKQRIRIRNVQQILYILCYSNNDNSLVWGLLNITPILPNLPVRTFTVNVSASVLAVLVAMHL